MNRPSYWPAGLILLLFGLVLAGCGQVAAPPATALIAPTSPPTAAAPTSPPTAAAPTSPPTAAAPTSPPTAAAPTSPPTAAAPTSPPTAEAIVSSAYADIPQGRTAEGYPYLGDPAAAVTLEMFSDFL